jgi:hypothetical protein
MRVLEERKLINLKRILFYKKEKEVFQFITGNLLWKLKLKYAIWRNELLYVNQSNFVLDWWRNLK